MSSGSPNPLLNAPVASGAFAADGVGSFVWLQSKISHDLLIISHKHISTLS